MTKCDYCGRLGNSQNCKGCGAAMNHPAIIYDSRVLDGDIRQYLFRPGHNINIPLSLPYGRGLADVIEIQRRFNA